MGYRCGAGLCWLIILKRVVVKGLVLGLELDMFSVPSHDSQSFL